MADAAVIGKVFWAGAVADMGDRDPDGRPTCCTTCRARSSCGPSRRSSMQGQAQYAFWHMLTRDVAYSQLPPPERASRHVAAAAWIESQALRRIEDVADVLAYHYSTALDLAHATGDTDQAAALEDPARRFLTLAGDAARSGLDTDAALTNLRARARAHPREPH